MAKRLPNFDWSKQSVITLDRGENYPWTEWLDGDIWELTQRKDFQPHFLMMERIIRTRATHKSLKAKVRLRHPSKGVIVLQRHDIVGPMERKQQEQKEKLARSVRATAEQQGMSINDLIEELRQQALEQ
jgi:hypothetical protein